MTTPASPKTDIINYQKVLQRFGYYKGDIDGIWGPQTQRANDIYVAATKPQVLPAPPALPPGTLGEITSTILATARHFLDLSETVSNARWDDLVGGSPHHDPRGEEFRQALLATGWQPSWAYCIAFAEVCWRKGYAGRPELALISSSITPSVMATFDNFDHMKRITRVATPGSIMLMQHGSSYLGHAGIVIDVEGGDTLVTIEANTSPVIDSREGDGIYLKKKPLDFNPRASGLWIRGFVAPFTV